MGSQKLGSLRETTICRRNAAFDTPQALAAGTIFLLAALGPVLDMLGNRGYRAAQLEAGMRTGRIYLGAYASGFAATASTFYDATCFVAPGTGKSPLLAAAVGCPAT